MEGKKQLSNVIWSLEAGNRLPIGEGFLEEVTVELEPVMCEI
jgi:hypothetical protein